MSAGVRLRLQPTMQSTVGLKVRIPFAPAASLQTVGPPRDESSGRQSGGETNRRTTLPSSCGDMPCGGVEVPDLPGDTHQVGIIQLRRHIVFVGLGEEPAKTQGLVEERQGDIERRLPFFDPKRNLPATLARADVIMASQAEGIEAERLLPLARDGDQDRGPFDFVRLPAEQLPVGIEHNEQMRPGINAMPSVLLLRHRLLHRLGLWLFRHFQGSSKNLALRLRDRA